MGRDRVIGLFLDSNVDPGTCVTWQNHSDRTETHTQLF